MKSILTRCLCSVFAIAVMGQAASAAGKTSLNKPGEMADFMAEFLLDQGAYSDKMKRVKKVIAALGTANYELKEIRSFYLDRSDNSLDPKDQNCFTELVYTHPSEGVEEKEKTVSWKALTSMARFPESTGTDDEPHVDEKLCVGQFERGLVDNDYNGIQKRMAELKEKGHEPKGSY